MIVYCHSCSAEVELKGAVGRRDVCACGAELRCCLQCEVYDEKTGRCREPQAEAPRELDRANFCEYFAASTARPEGVEDREAAAKAAFDALFKKR